MATGEPGIGYVISNHLWKQISEPTLKKPSAAFKSYPGQRLILREEVKVEIEIAGKTRKVLAQLARMVRVLGQIGYRRRQRKR